MKNKLLSLFLIIITALCCAALLPACKKEEVKDGAPKEEPFTYGFVTEDKYEGNQTPKSSLAKELDLYVGEPVYFFVDYKMPVGEDSEMYTIGITVSPVQNVRARIEYAGTKYSEDTVNDERVMTANFTPYDKQREVRVIILLTPTKEGNITFKGEVLHDGEKIESGFNVSASVTLSPNIGSGLSYVLNSDKQSYSVSGIGKETGNYIYIPETYEGLPVTGIADNAFKDCTFAEIIIPDSVTSIGDNAFENCTLLTNIIMPDSLISIGNSALSGCSSLVYNECNNAKYLGNVNNLYVVLVKASNNYLTSCEINENTKIIYHFAFADCSSLVSVTIPDSVTSIGDNSFSNCPIETATMPAFAAKHIKIDALKSVIITCGEEINSCAFSNCGKLASITISNGVKAIGMFAFYNCSSLTSVTIPDSVTSIDDWAFRNCSSLESIAIGSGLTSMEGFSFDEYTSLKTIIVAESNEKYKSLDGNLYGKDGKTLIQYAIGKAETSFIIPDSVNSVGSKAFSNCNSLKSVTIPDSVTSIGYEAFSNCTSLTSIIILGNIISVGSRVFSNCSSLTDITILGSIASIGSSMFYSCSSLASITIPNSVTKIGDSAFSHCGKLTSVTIPNSVTSIGGSAFYYCNSLTGITIPDSVTSIDNSVFTGCNSLKSITIPNGVAVIEGYMFYDCVLLTSIIIPNGVKAISDYVLKNCTSLTEITFKGTEAQWDAIEKGESWNYNTGNYVIHCTDGDIAKS